MADNIKIDMETVEIQSSAFEKLAEDFEAKSMEDKDTKTTVPANERCQETFDKNEENIKLLGENFMQYASNIKKLGDEFSILDKVIANVNKIL